MPDEKDTLKRYLQAQRDALRWKLDGLGERDARWPMTPTGTNLLGLVKHVASMEYEYFGNVFDRPAPEPLPWLDDDAEANADLWATVDQSREWVAGFYQRAITHADATIDALALDDTGTVPWWPADGNTVTLHWILVHMIAETARHAGHADIVRETVDGAIGLRQGVSNLPDRDAQWWTDYVEKLKRTAEEAQYRT
ncbi:DinB family protein [Jiangella muralis]|uniref:DinB family protein n=1 Tax=Jiangella muralis TaxID=702383 RepID=UPI00069EDD0B|nr:DinB family protein [Jiangella muralis]